jgi:hypothetical protein
MILRWRTVLPSNYETKAGLSVERIDVPTLSKVNTFVMTEQGKHDLQSGVSAAGKALKAASSALSAYWLIP